MFIVEIKRKILRFKAQSTVDVTAQIRKAIIYLTYHPVYEIAPPGYSDRLRNNHEEAKKIDRDFKLKARLRDSPRY